MKKYFKQLTRLDLIFLLSLFLLANVLYIWPYLYGYLQTPIGYFFNGNSPLSEADIYVYYSYIEQVKEGHSLFSNMFDNEPHGRIFFSIFWFLVGKIAANINVPIYIIFFLIKSFFILLFVFLINYFFGIFFEKKWQKNMATFLTLFSGGLGVYFSLFYYASWGMVRDSANYPIDLWAPEFSPWLSILYLSPHILASLFTLFLLFTLLINDFKRKDFKLTFFIAIIALLYWQFHPYYYILFFLVWGTYLLILFLYHKKIIFKWLYKLIIVGSISSISFIYHLYLIYFNDFYILKSKTNITLSPRIDVLIVSYGLIFVGALIAIYLLFKNFKNNKDKFNIKVNDINYFKYNNGTLKYPVFLFTYFFVNLFLIYSPLRIQRRFIQGFYIILIILSVFAADYFLDKIKKRFSILSKQYVYFWLIIIYFLCFVPSVVFSIKYQMNFYNDYPQLFYYSEEQNDVLQYIKNNLGKDDVIITDFYLARFIPAIANKRVYYGHWSETLFLIDKKKYWDNFLLGKNDIKSMKDKGITHMIIKKDDFSNLNIKPIQYKVIYENEKFYLLIVK